MYLAYWGLQKAPFHRHIAGGFFRGSPQQEALARLHYLVQSPLGVGILVGPAGVGKHSVLEEFARELRREHHAVVTFSLLALDYAEWTWQVARRLACALEHTVPGTALIWDLIPERLGVLTFQQRGIVFLFRDADRCREEVLLGIQRLVHGVPGQATATSIVLSMRAPDVGVSLASVAPYADLRIDLEPWTMEDTADYLLWSLRSAGRELPTFELRAVEAIHHLSHGNPKQVRQLAELSLVAAAAEQLAQVDVATVRDVGRELAIADLRAA